MPVFRGSLFRCVLLFDKTFFPSLHQDQDSLLVKRRNDNHSPGPVIRELVPTPYARSFRRKVFAFHYAVNHPPTNIILS